MTIIEAAQLVIQAGAMGKNSEVFVLDMGESIKIKDLIEKMINFSEFTIKNDKNTKDIEIKISGLDPVKNFMRNCWLEMIHKNKSSKNIND